MWYGVYYVYRNWCNECLCVLHTKTRTNRQLDAAQYHATSNKQETTTASTTTITTFTSISAPKENSFPRRLAVQHQTAPTPPPVIISASDFDNRINLHLTWLSFFPRTPYNHDGLSAYILHPPFLLSYSFCLYTFVIIIPLFLSPCLSFLDFFLVFLVYSILYLFFIGVLMMVSLFLFPWCSSCCCSSARPVYSISGINFSVNKYIINK